MPIGVYQRKIIHLRIRFEKKVALGPGCQLWMGSRVRRGSYGQITIAQKLHLAHRVAYELYKGSIPHGVCVLHRCDCPPCVNPEHLFLGDRKDNMQDAASKGRICTVGQSRKTHCVHDHDFTPSNTIVDKLGYRHCLICRRSDYERRNKQRRKNRKETIL